MSIPFKKALVIWATSGIGLELAERLVQEGAFVIAVGRRQANLDAFVSKVGADKGSGVAFDLVDIEKIPSFAEGITKTHPDIDCVVLNAGVQYSILFSKLHTVDIAKIQREITINYTSMVALTHAFLPFFQTKPANEEASFIYTSSLLESIQSPLVINYCATKAALRSFILSIRELMKDTPSPKINIVEVYTPLVQSELHDAQPGWNKDFNPGMPVVDFISGVLEGLKAKRETIAVGGMAEATWAEFEEPRAKCVGPRWEAMKKFLGVDDLFKYALMSRWNRTVDEIVVRNIWNGFCDQGKGGGVPSAYIDTIYQEQFE